MNKKFGFLSSSVNSEQLSQAVNGIIIVIAGFVALIAANHGISITAPEVQAQLSALAVAVGMLWTAFGMIRKVVVWVNATFLVR